MTKEELESGLKKYEIIAPLLNNDLDGAEKRKVRNEIMTKHNISERTLRRYVYKYSKDGYEGLITQHRKDKGKSKTISKTILEKAIELRQEMPQRSVRNIIKILESEGEIESSTVPKSTLSRQLLQNGYGAKVVKSQEQVTHGSKRFQRVGRNSLWQLDIKYGPYIPGKDGKKIRTYILCLIDDATRLVVHGEIYENQSLPILEDCFRKALLKFGVPQSVYVDNGKIFISKWFRLACARLGIKHINTKPYSPASKGKIEKFNGFINEFMGEISIEPAKNIIDLNKKFRIWLEEGYNNKPHSGIKDKTPMDAYRENPAKVRFASPNDFHDLFLWEETRTVDNSACVKFKGNQYEVGIEFIRKKVDLRYDPFDLSVVEVFQNGVFVRKSSPLVIGESVQKPQIEKAPAKKPTNSRLLAAYEKDNELRDKQRNAAISFIGLEKEDSHNV